MSSSTRIVYRSSLVNGHAIFPRRLHPFVNWLTVCRHINFSPYGKRDAFGRNYYPSLFAVENISHHCRINICFRIREPGVLSFSRTVAGGQYNSRKLRSGNFIYIRSQKLSSMFFNQSIHFNLFYYKQRKIAINSEKWTMFIYIIFHSLAFFFISLYMNCYY